MVALNNLFFLELFNSNSYYENYVGHYAETASVMDEQAQKC